MQRKKVFTLTMLFVVFMFSAACRQANLDDLTGVWIFDEQKTLAAADKQMAKELRDSAEKSGFSIADLIFGRVSSYNNFMEADLRLKKIKMPYEDTMKAISEAEVKGKTILLKFSPKGSGSNEQATFEMIDQAALVVRKGGAFGAMQFDGCDLYFNKADEETAERFKLRQRTVQAQNIIQQAATATVAKNKDRGNGGGQGNSLDLAAYGFRPDPAVAFMITEKKEGFLIVAAHNSLGALAFAYNSLANSGVATLSSVNLKKDWPDATLENMRLNLYTYNPLTKRIDKVGDGPKLGPGRNGEIVVLQPVTMAE